MQGLEPLLTFQTESRNGVTRVALIGQLDLSTAPLLRNHLEEIDGDGLHAIMLDLRDLSFADSMALHVFLDARKFADSNGHRLLLVGARPNVRRLFEVTDTAFLIDERHAVGVLDRFTGGAARGSSDDASKAGPDG